MIYVERSPDTTPACLKMNDSNSAGINEREKARVFYQGVKNRVFYKKSRKGIKNYDFNVYKRPEVRSALESLFHRKCAYCEGRYARFHPVDIEHWRPKGGIIVDGIFTWPGYWWLAADWNNLLPSCIDCNRFRYHPVSNEKEDEGHGKENRFPIYLEEGRAGPGEGTEEKEKPLLLHPCRDRPESYLNYFSEAGLVVPRKSLAGERLERASSSIEVYGLDRAELCEARRDYMTRVLNQVDCTLQAFGEAKEHSERTSLRQALAEEVRALCSMRAATAEYSAVARAGADILLEDIRTWLVGTLAGEFAGAGEQVMEKFLKKYPSKESRSERLNRYVAQVELIRGS